MDTKTHVIISIALFFRTTKAQRTAQVSICCRIAKQAVIYPYKGRWLKRQKEQPTETYDNIGVLKNILSVKEAFLKEYLLSDSGHKVLLQSKLVSNDRNQDSHCLCGVGGCGDWFRRGKKESPGVDGNVLCLDNCLHFLGVSLVKMQGTFKICAFHYTKFYLKNILNAEWVLKC